jgi:hypothetical protein
MHFPLPVREIGDNAFSSASSLRDLVFEEGVVRIGAYAFQYCAVALCPGTSTVFGQTINMPIEY